MNEVISVFLFINAFETQIHELVGIRSGLK